MKPPPARTAVEVTGQSRDTAGVGEIHHRGTGDQAKSRLSWGTRAAVVNPGLRLTRTVARGWLDRGT